jgi:DNA-binding MarR family transcriptional regulator
LDSQPSAAETIEALTNAMVAGGSVLLREAGRLFRPFGLTVAHFNVLHLLAGAPAGLRPSDLTASLVVDASSTTYLLDQMEKRGWMQRRRDLHDRRGYRVRIAPAGKKLFDQVAPLYKSALGEMGRQLPLAQAERLTDVLKQIRQFAPRAVDQVLQSRSQSGAKTSRGAKPRRPRPRPSLP